MCGHEWVDWYSGPMGVGKQFWECKKCGARQYDDPTVKYTGRPDVTLLTHPDHDVVGHEWVGGYPWQRWFCESHDEEGYWMYPTNGSGDWHNVSERAIHRSFHRVYKDPDGFWSDVGRVPPYKTT